MDENQSIISLVQKCSLNCIISPKSLVSTHLNELRGKEGGREVKGAGCPLLLTNIITIFQQLLKQIYIIWVH